MLRNENIPVVHQVHAYDDADVALTMALPWVHELGWPLTTVRLLLALELAITWLCLRRLVIDSLGVEFFDLSSPTWGGWEARSADAAGAARSAAAGAARSG